MSSIGLFAAGDSCWEWQQTGLGIQPWAEPTLGTEPTRLFSEGQVAKLASDFLWLPNFSECNRRNNLRKQNISNDKEDERKTLLFFFVAKVPGMQISMLTCFPFYFFFIKAYFSSTSPILSYQQVISSGRDIL